MGHYKKVDFDSEQAMWITFIFNWISLIIILSFWSYAFLIFCFRSQSPKFHQFSSKEISHLNHRIRGRSSVSVLTRSSMSMDKPNNQNSQNSRQLSMIGLPIKQSVEEFEIQICKIHRNLRLLFLCSITCSVLYISYTCLNQAIVVFSDAKSRCTANKFPTFFLGLQRISLYTFFIMRIHYSFGKTQYKINIKCIAILQIFVILVPILSVSGFIYTSISTCDDMSKAAALVAICDFFVQLMLISTFLNRLIKAIGLQKNVFKSQSKETIFNVLNISKSRKHTSSEIKIRREMQRTYKFYYTIFKLFVLFASTVTLTWIAIGIGLASSSLSSSACYDQIVSNIMLFLAFQFNDNHYRYLFHCCLKCQSCCLGSEYAQQMEDNFVSRVQHRMGSRTFMKYDSQFLAVSRGAKSTTNIGTDEPLEPITERDDDLPANKSKHLHIPAISALDDGNENKYKNVDACTPLESEENSMQLMNNDSGRYDTGLSSIVSNSLVLKSNVISNSVSGKSDNVVQSAKVPLIVIKDMIEKEDKEITPTSKDSQNVDENDLKDVDIVHLEHGDDSFIHVEHLNDIPPDGPTRISSFESA